MPNKLLHFLSELTYMLFQNNNLIWKLLAEVLISLNI